MSQQQMTISQAMDVARAHHSAGRLREAESIYRQILGIQPANVDALHALGTLAFQTRNFAAAAELFGHAAKANPDDPSLACNLGQALAADGKLDDAVAAYQRAIASYAEFAPAHNLLGDALDLQGKTEQSIAAYREAIARQPDFADAHNNLGVVLQRIGSIEEAIASFRQALSIRPDFLHALNNLGECLRSSGRTDQAIEILRQATRTAPSAAEVHRNLGLALRDKKEFAAAASEFRQAIALNPNSAQTLSDLAGVLQSKGELDLTVAALEQAIRIAPDFAEAYSNLGSALHAKGSSEAAVAAYEKALALRPEFPEALNNLGNALHSMKRTDEAIELCRRAIQIRPDFMEAHHNLGIALERNDRLDEALHEYDEAIRLRPDFAEAHNNRGSPLHSQGHYDQAIESFRRAVALNPDYVLAHYNLGLSLLLRGDFERGWPEHELRLGDPELARVSRDFKQPKWDGSDPAGKRILLYVEQGFGDTIQFIRYAPLLAARGAKLIVGCRPELKRLLKSVDGIEQWIVEGDPLPDFDFQCSLLSLPHLFKHNSVESFPTNIPYIKAEAELSKKWRERLSGIKSSLKVGLVWAGGSAHANDRNRSIRLEMLAPLAAATDVQFISLQKGPPAEQATNAPPGMNLLDVSEDLNDFAETAALIEQLDLVIAVDTSVAHVAGAIGTPVWVLLPFVPDWRWMLHRTDSPWYPKMQLFRQSTIGKWDEPIEQICVQLMK